jgi:hypothetical protein
MRISGLCRSFAALAIVYLTTCFATGIFLAELAVHPARRALASADEHRARKIANSFDADLENVGIAVRHSERIRARNPRVMFWEVPNADHCGAISSDPDQFVV